VIGLYREQSGSCFLVPWFQIIAPWIYTTSLILSTAPSSKAMSELIDGLGTNGKLVVVGMAFDPIEVAPVQLITGVRNIQGWMAGIPTDSEDTLRCAELTGVRAMIETYPHEKAAEASARMLSGHAQFRVVLTM
jgi:D-arabinose 1-dehydrogenase-like Zn-dependent alcohol dehydrogenase